MERITHDGEMLAIIIPADHQEAGVEFFTPPEFSQQLAYMKHPTGHVIEAHTHKPVSREVHLTQEALFIRHGRLRVDFYTSETEYLESRILAAGDVILLTSGGHGFEVLEEVEMVEVKQGPYAGDADKVRFKGTGPSESPTRVGE
jgi:mannose-6-phosphate isomerase-like protein (cupin superfamily)